MTKHSKCKCDNAHGHYTIFTFCRSITLSAESLVDLIYLQIYPSTPFPLAETIKEDSLVLVMPQDYRNKVLRFQTKDLAFKSTSFPFHSWQISTTPAFNIVSVNSHAAPSPFRLRYICPKSFSFTIHAIFTCTLSPGFKEGI